MKRLKLTLLGLSLVLIGYAQNENPELELPDPPAVEWKTISNPKFSMQYPDYWQADESGLMGSTFFLFAPLSDPEDDFRENINMMEQDLQGLDIDLDKFTEISMSQIERVVSNAQLILNERVEKDSLSFQRIIYSGKQGIYDLQFEQYYFIKNEKAFILTLTCKASEFDDYQEIGESILNSFEFIDPKQVSKTKKI